MTFEIEAKKSDASAIEGRRTRTAGIRQSDITRAIRGALQAGMDISEVIATKDGVHILAAGAQKKSSDNSWDAVLSDG